MPNTPIDFEEIAHCGGKVTISISKTESGGLAYSVGFRSDRPVPMSLFCIYALPPGIPIEPIPGIGMGQPFPVPRIPGSRIVFVASDREGLFGRQCGWCDRYWRSRIMPRLDQGFCPYCGRSPEGQLTLTDAQNRYVAQFLVALDDALDNGPGDYEIDMDAVADAAGKEGVKPDFFYSEERQQTRVKCGACHTSQDVLGTRSYCCYCGTRNDLDLLKAAIESARERTGAGAPEGALRDASSAWDSYVGAVASELVDRVPMTRAREAYWSKSRSRHKIAETIKRFDGDFGFSAGKALGEKAISQCSRMMERRHIHEHNGGIVDQKYLDATGDSLRIGSVLRETPAEVHEYLSHLAKAGDAISSGFAEIFPPDQRVIEHCKRYPGGG